VNAELGIATAGGWIRLLVGTVVLLLPGLALADRVFPDRRLPLLLAPVFSLTLLPLAAILLDALVGVPVTAATTALLALALAVMIGAPRLRALTEAA